MLSHVTWTLTPIEDAVLPRAFGLALTKELHRRLGVTLGEEAMPSTTTSGLIGKVIPTQDFLTFPKQEPYRLSLCGLQQSSSQAIAALELSPIFEFLGATFQIMGHTTQTDSYEALYQKWIAAEPEPAYQHTLKFLSPTAFSQEGLYLPLPLPRLMFRSWLDRWNHFSTIYLGGDELLDYLGSAIAIKHHSLYTRTVPIHQGTVTGFLGQVTLSVLKRSDPLLVNVARLLIQYSSYSGVGIKTRLGMGSIHLET